jgi:CHASE3 domain sensor protein
LKISFRLVLGALYVMLVITMGILAVIAYRNNIESDEKAASVRHTQHVIEMTYQISALSREMQQESSFYVVAGDEGAKHRYQVARANLLDQLEVIRTLTIASARQQARLDTLQQVLDDMVRFNDSAFLGVPLVKEEELADRMGRNTNFRIAISKILESAREEERHVMQFQEADYSASRRNYTSTYSLLLAGMGVILLSSFIIIRYNFNKRREVQADLARSNELFVTLFNESPVAGLLCRAQDLIVVN